MGDISLRGRGIVRKKFAKGGVANKRIVRKLQRKTK
jgi:hypothetical protein